MHYIMNKDIPVLCIDTCEVLNFKLLPLALQLSNLTPLKVSKWILDRAIPMNRVNSDKIYKAIRLDSDNKEMDLMYLTHSLSINDNFWIASDKEIEALKYETISLFINKLSTELNRVALLGDDITNLSYNDTSAEYTGQGSFAKCFVSENNEIHMIKYSQRSEVIAEIEAAHIAKVIGLDTADYSYETVENKLCSKSKILTNLDTNWESAFSLAEYFEHELGAVPQEYCLQHKMQRYIDMIIFDALVLNDDRHMKNWSFEINSDMSNGFKIAPSYDYNKAFQGNSNTFSSLLFDDNRRVNILQAGRIAYRDYGTKLKLNDLYNSAKYMGFHINADALLRRIEYIVGTRLSQNDCY